MRCDIDAFLDLMRQIDYVFELCLTDNEATDKLFQAIASQSFDYNLVKREDRKRVLKQHYR